MSQQLEVGLNAQEKEAGEVWQDGVKPKASGKNEQHMENVEWREKHKNHNHI